MIQIDTKKHEVRIDGRDAELTPTEFDLLVALRDRRGALMDYNELLRLRGDGANRLTTQTLSQHVARLRRKLGKHRGIIKTVFCRGYRFNARA